MFGLVWVLGGEVVRSLVLVVILHPQASVLNATTCRSEYDRPHMMG